MDSDPYQPPTSRQPDETFHVRNREIIIGWEKLRIVYNGILLIVGLAVVLEARQAGMYYSEIIGGVLLMAVGANACYCIGPMSELYICTLSKKPDLSLLRIPMFVLGLIMSLALFGLIYLVIGFGALNQM